MKQSITTALILVIFACTSVKNPARTDSAENDESLSATEQNIDWEAFDFGSTVQKTEITTENLQGLWEARRSVVRFGSNNRVVKMETPVIIEIENDTYRKSSESAFRKYSLRNNLFIDSDAGDTGIINKITATEFTVSWRQGGNYTRYYYAK